ncbi:hypothetical protein C8Q73DRAFT_672650 [Cubamyces lactineus]|nr:hypothetical protein C8Q73DRAFT_672650 [Cubamyces lactineus]
MMLIAIFSMALTILNTAHLSRCNPIPPGVFRLGSSFSIGFRDGADSVGVLLIKGVIVVQGLCSGSVGLDSITITFDDFSSPVPSLPPIQLTIRAGQPPAWIISVDPKYRFPPPPTTPIPISSHHLNFSTLNDIRVAWSRRKWRRRRRRTGRLYAALRTPPRSIYPVHILSFTLASSSPPTKPWSWASSRFYLQPPRVLR